MLLPRQSNGPSELSVCCRRKLVRRSFRGESLEPGPITELSHVAAPQLIMRPIMCRVRSLRQPILGDGFFQVLLFHLPVAGTDFLAWAHGTEAAKK